MNCDKMRTEKTSSIFMKKSLILASLGILIAFPVIASAHERQLFQIGNTDYIFVVGSLNEPVVVDDKTGVDLRVKIADPSDPTNSSAANAKPALGLDQTLKVEISAGNKKKVLDLSPSYGDPGAYHAPFYPTIQTTYSYRFFGKISNEDVDLIFTCNPAGHPRTEDDSNVVKMTDSLSRKFKAGAFGCPLGKADLGFPEKANTIHDLGNKIPKHTTLLLTAALVLSVVALVYSFKKK